MYCITLLTLLEDLVAGCKSLGGDVGFSGSNVTFTDLGSHPGELRVDTLNNVGNLLKLVEVINCVLDLPVLEQAFHIETARGVGLVI